jgi:tetratricopeptide (TPR) repeat protein
MVQNPPYITNGLCRSVLCKGCAPLLYALVLAVPCTAAAAGQAYTLAKNEKNAVARAGDETTNPDTALARAQSLSDAAQALELYNKIASDKTAPGSVRSEAWFRLGCASYMTGRFHKAASYLKKAAEAAGCSVYTQAYYLNAIHDTADSFFIKTLTKETEDTVLPAGKTAHFYLALFYYARKDFSRALTHFRTAADSTGSVWWAYPADVGAYCCAEGLGHPEEATGAYDRTNKNCPACLEKAMMEKAKIKPALSAEAFTLQVGAFSTRENAQSYITSLSKQFADVSVSMGTLGNKTFYRVRIGAFATKESAQAYGDSALAKKGITFRVVEESPVQ